MSLKLTHLFQLYLFLLYNIKLKLLYTPFWKLFEKEIEKQVMEEANAKPMEDINRYISLSIISLLSASLICTFSLGKPNFHMIFGHDSFKHKSTIPSCIVTTSLVFASPVFVRYFKKINAIKTNQ